MPHSTPLIATIVVCIGFAFVLGAIAHRLRLSPIVGYLAAGVLAGPFTPGFVADQSLAPELAELGVIMLMFGVGLHFSLADLMSVRWIAIPGALIQIAVATAMGAGLGLTLGWSLIESLVFGVALSIASTVVLTRALQERRLTNTARGRIAVGWLIVEDLAMVMVLVLLPALAQTMKGETLAPGELEATLLMTLGKVVAFVLLMLVIGRRVVPWLLHEIAHSGSRELFRLAVLAIALGIAFGASELFGVSFALGAFFAGMILSESELSQRAAEEILPLRDAFAVLFFVSAGMLFNPMVILTAPLSVITTVAIIIVGKSLAALAIVRACRYDRGTALTIATSLAQIGEFSFILASLGVGLAVLPAMGKDLIVAGAIISILLNPLLFLALDRYLRRHEPDAPEVGLTLAPDPTLLNDHIILVGHGRVGRLITDNLPDAETAKLLVLDEREDRLADLAARGIESMLGNVVRPEILTASRPEAARLLFVAIPNGFEAGQIVAQARALNPGLRIVARAHSDAEVEHLIQYGASRVILGEREIARGMMEDGLGLTLALPTDRHDDDV